MIEPRSEELLAKTDDYYTLVVLASRRARQIVDYYTKLGAGLEEKPVPPLLEGTVHGLKPLTIALREVATEKIGFERAADTQGSVK